MNIEKSMMKYINDYNNYSRKNTIIYHILYYKENYTLYAIVL